MTDSVAEQYRSQGYQLHTVEWGLDFVAARGDERVAILRKDQVDRAAVLHLEGVRRYWDCSSAVLVSPGPAAAAAQQVADKLGIALVTPDSDFERIWDEWIRPLQGQNLEGDQILQVNESGLERVNSRGQTSFLPVEIFRMVVQRLEQAGEVSGDELSLLCQGRAAASVARILAQAPQIEYAGRPARLCLHSGASVGLEAHAPLELEGFVGFESVHSLWKSSAHIPGQRGVYAVLRAAGFEPEFLLQGSGGHSKGNPNVSIGILRSKWVPESAILYLGKAGGGDSKATLNSRLKQLLDFGRGKPAKHYGGRYLWQLRQAGALQIAWRVCEQPEQLETDLLNQFVQRYGRLPFANLQD
jgi:hypothetical protein